MAKEKNKKDFDIQEIKTKISNYRTELLNLRFKRKSGQLENTSQFKLVKKHIARFLTLKRIKERNKNA